MVLYHTGNVVDLVVTIWGATTRPWPEQRLMAWWIHLLGPVRGPIALKTIYAVGAIAAWHAARSAFGARVSLAPLVSVLRVWSRSSSGTRSRATYVSCLWGITVSPRSGF